MHNLNMTQLSKIKIGDTIMYEEHFLKSTTIYKGLVKSVACRCGFDSDGYLNSDEDYLIVETVFNPVEGPVENEVSYADVLEVL